VTRIPRSLNYFLTFFGCMDQGVSLYKYKVVGIVRYDKVLKEAEIGVSRVPMFL
jgi:hypothetical protein